MDKTKSVSNTDIVYLNVGDFWRLYLQSVKNRVFVGVLDSRYRDSRVSESLTKRINNTHVPPVNTWKGSYGWILGENVQNCSDGKVLNTSIFGPLGKTGDTIELVLKTTTYDLNTSTHLLLFIQPSGVKRSLPLPNSQAWQCIVGSYCAGDRVCLLS